MRTRVSGGVGLSGDAGLSGGVGIASSGVLAHTSSPGDADTPLPQHAVAAGDAAVPLPTDTHTSLPGRATAPHYRGPLPEGEEKVRVVRAMFDGIAPRYDLVNRVLTFRMDVGWRRRAVASLGLAPGALVLDLGAGTGDLCRELHGAGLGVVGVDLSAGMLAHARTAAPLVQGDVLGLPLPDAVAEGAVSGFTLRNLVDLDRFFAELARVVRPGGRVALLEVSEPTSPLLRWGHRVWFGKVTPLVGGLLSDPAAYRYLPRSVAYLPPVPRLLALLEEAGFEAVRRQALSGGIAQLVTATRAGTP